MTVTTERSLFALLGARTSPGSWRTNEDAFLASDLDRKITLRPQDLPVSIAPPTNIVVGVYDGLGVHNDGDGERMSQLAAEAVHAAMVTSVLAQRNLGIALTDALAAANDVLREKWSSDRRCHGSYSFATVAAFNATGLWVAHVGGGYAILVRNGAWCPLSRNQTLGRALVDRAHALGLEQPPEATPHHDAPMNALPGPRVTPVVSFVPLRRGDRLLLCTSGLRRTIKLPAMVSALRSKSEPDHVCDTLLRTGATTPRPMNMTVAVVDFVWEGWPEPHEEDPMPILVETSTGWFVKFDE